MARELLNDDQKAEIAHLFATCTPSQTRLAKTFNVSRRTIGRVLVEKGMLPAHGAMSAADQAIINVARQHGLDAATLDQALNIPAMTHANVQQYLINLGREEIAQLLYDVAMVRLIVNLGDQPGTNALQKEAA